VGVFDDLWLHTRFDDPTNSLGSYHRWGRGGWVVRVSSLEGYGHCFSDRAGRTGDDRNYPHGEFLFTGWVHGGGERLWPVYPAFARWFIPFFESDYVALRCANTSALVLTLSLLAWVLRRERAGGLVTAGIVMVVYALNVSSHSVAASADFLAAFFCFAALVAGGRGTWPMLLLCIFLSALGLGTKLYAAFGWGVMASHLLLFGPRRKGWIFIGVSLAAGLIGVWAVQHRMPYYFLSTFAVHSVTSASSFSVLCRQTLDFSLLTIGLLALGVGTRVFRVSRSAAPKGPQPRITVDFWDWAAVCGAVALVGRLGWHEGNYLVYFYHLLLLPLAVIAGRRAVALPKIAPALLGLNLLVVGYRLPPLPGSSNWDQVERLAAETPSAILADPFFEPLRARRPNIELFERGHAATILQTLDRLTAERRARYAQVHRDLLENVANVNARISAQAYDAIFVSYQNLPDRVAWGYDRERYASAILANYRPVGGVRFYPYCAPFWDRDQHGKYAFFIEKWVPLRTGSEAPSPGISP
jgi:hypothetical protein